MHNRNTAIVLRSVVIHFNSKPNISSEQNKYRKVISQTRVMYERSFSRKGRKRKLCSYKK